MTNTKDRPVSFPMRLPEDVERLLLEIVHRPLDCCRELRGWSPSIDLYDTADAYILEADLPGVKARDIEIEIDDHNDLILHGRRDVERTYGHGQLRVMERSSGYFMRRLNLPESVQKTVASTEFSDGVLRAIIRKLRVADD